MPWPSAAPSRRSTANIIYVALYGSQMQKAAEKLGLPMALEGFPDRRYDDDGNLASRTHPRHRAQGPQGRAPSRRVRMVRDGEIVALNGKRIKVKVHTLCVHGDEATGVVGGARHPPGAGGRPTSPSCR